MFNFLDVQMTLNFLFFIKLFKCTRGLLFESLLY